MRGRDSCAVEQSFCVGGLPLLESEACADPIDPPCADQASTRCSRVDPTVWSQILTPSGESTGCSGSYLCASGGVAFGTTFCEEFHGSGDMKWSHPCRASGAFDAKCIQDACDAFEPCGGYMTTPDGDSYWLYGNDVSVQDWANANYQCWGPPLAEDGSPSCSCLSGGIVPARPDSYECVDKSPMPSPPLGVDPSPNFSCHAFIASRLADDFATETRIFRRAAAKSCISTARSASPPSRVARPPSAADASSRARRSCT